MYEIIFYEDRNGVSEIVKLIEELDCKAQTDKSSRIRLKKISEYLQLLESYGTRIGEPVTKHLTKQGNLWELRPTSDRIFFAYWENNKFVLLHHFVKKTQKTPAREIEQAQRNLADFLERSR